MSAVRRIDKVINSLSEFGVWEGRFSIRLCSQDAVLWILATLVFDVGEVIERVRKRTSSSIIAASRSMSRSSIFSLKVKEAAN